MSIVETSWTTSRQSLDIVNDFSVRTLFILRNPLDRCVTAFLIEFFFVGFGGLKADADKRKLLSKLLGDLIQARAS